MAHGEVLIKCKIVENVRHFVVDGVVDVVGVVGEALADFLELLEFLFDGREPVDFEVCWSDLQKAQPEKMPKI